MPQVDILVAACAGGSSERKITCETLAVGDGGAEDDPPKNDFVSGESNAADVPSDFPPESFWLPKDDENDWLDRNAFFERKESAKGNDPNSASVNTNSQKFPLNLKSTASIIGLPKTQKATLAASRRRTCKATNMRLFPKRAGSTGKSTGPVAEPGSPKVSCMGRVRSKRCRRRSNSLKRGEKPAENFKSSGQNKKTTFYSKVMSMFRSKKSQKKQSLSGSRRMVEATEEKPVVVEPRRRSASIKARRTPGASEPEAEPPVLGGMKKFASGRQSGAWIGEEFNQGELDLRVSRR